LATIVDRKSRFIKAMHMPNRKSATFNKYCIAALSILPSSLVNTLTVDRGKEFAGYASLEKELKTSVYFADPYSSWQRGTNENSNGLIREFFPKKFDFSTISQFEVNKAINLINNRPRKCLGYKTSSEV
ncbi:IS30 family transposase, partial [Clostridium botulinum]|nr:IS30 family transposase [Clostridium botulinum]